MEARKIIVKIQAIVDEISHFIWKPVVIECKEIGFFIDMEKNQMLLNGLFLPLSKVWLVQTVETDKGYYAVEVYTSGGDVYVTTEGRDKTLYVSETVKMVAERANIPFQRVRNREVRYPFRDFPYMEKVKIEDWRMRTRRITNRFFTDKGDGSIEKVLDTERS